MDWIIIVNDVNYGRWANKTNHKAWYQGNGRGGQFNAWWHQIEAAEKDLMDNGGALTKLDLIEKLGGMPKHIF